MNLDSLSQEELLKLSFEFWYHPRINAKKFGLKVSDMKLLSHYASNKAAAISCQFSGNIERALMYERICENLYNRLSDNAKW